MPNENSVDAVSICDGSLYDLVQITRRNDPMRLRSRWIAAVILALFTLAIPVPSLAGVFIGVGVSVNIAPPPLPVYTQPMVPGPNYIWMPGYWAWGPAGYYWVPGTWVLAPRPGFLWTPGYWGWAPGGYLWHPGYWGPHIGFYGGINYGFGYFGVGFVGGGWYGGAFRYNTAVTNVNTTIVHNVYVDRTVINNYNNTTINRVSFNGGAGGIQARPTATELAAQNEQHLRMTPQQTAHVRMAGRDRNLLSSVNHGQPSQLSTTQPFARGNRPADFAPIRPEDRAMAQGKRVSNNNGASKGASNGAHYRQRESHPRGSPRPTRP
jgi:hypothetical protein